jgi:hypothetical protein
VLGSMAGKRRKQAGGQVDASARRAAESRLVRRLGEATELLAPAGIVVTPLDAGQATAVLASACNPDSLLPPSAGLAGADEVITTSGADLTDDDIAGDVTDGSYFTHRTTAPSRSPSGQPQDSDEYGDDWDYQDDSADDDYPDDYRDGCEDERGRS